ncbi:hypothetical protein OJAV_G00177370 [Oryzias javanicus]|uniref:Uncharacterized protein n=1 Tax=Oryzias javanicus TaxID=123683 RepID=A0A3S2P1R3_ORYJA|nr:hypothetical protein OJAV_G00177370 [Oryzias javanicus]
MTSAGFSRKPFDFSETMSLLLGEGAQTGCGDGLLLKIRAQLEEMFTDAYLAEDGFLLKHLQSRHGFVSLKLLTCLKKIKTLTTDWKVTLEAARSSDLLEVNDERTKLRRKCPLPQWLLCSPTSKLLLVWNAGEEQSRRAEHPSLLLTLLQKLGLSGGVAALWTVRPGEELPKELQCYTKRHQELGQHVCTVVKFELLEKVRRAYRALRAEEEDCNGKGLRVVALGSRSMSNFTKPSALEETNTPPDEDRSPEMTLSPPERSAPAERHEVQTEPDPLESVKLGTFPPDCECPWFLRRRSAAKHSALKTLTVLRQPLGPDGGRGFDPRGRDQTTILLL